ncbi:MAG: hypothetical protein RL748_1539, partial [Pseudomonadota bacterium]
MTIVPNSAAPGPVLHRRFSPASLRAGILLLSVLISLVLQWLTLPAGMHFGDEWLRDRFISWRADPRPESRFVLVDIDEVSLTQLGPWPWPRQRIADLVEQLIGPYGASGVALDMFFSEPLDAAGDLRLAMLAQHGPLVMAQAFDYNHEQALRVGRLIGGQATGLEQGAARFAVPASGFVANHAGLSQAAQVGNIGFIPDKDGMLRRLPLFTEFSRSRYPTLSLALFHCCQKNPPQADVQALVGVSGNGFWRVPYSRQLEAYTVVPASMILQQRFPLTALQGKKVLVGSSSLGLSDRVATPLSPNVSGLMVHAAALTTLLDLQAGHVPQRWPGRALACLYSVAIALLLWLGLPRLPAMGNLALLFGCSLAWLGAAYLLVPHDAQLISTGPL